MRTNLVLQANFVTNRFTAAAGSYNGLFAATGGVDRASAGFFSLRTTSGQAFTGKVMVDGGSYGLKGLFDINGHARAVVPRKGKEALTLALQLNLDPGADQITGTVGGGAWNADLLGDKLVFNGADNAATNLSGRYTLLLPCATNSPASPAGHGFGLVSIAPSGKVVLKGALGDGAAIQQAAFISKNGNWPLYAAAYPGSFRYPVPFGWATNREHKGFVIGWAGFTNAPRRTLAGSLVCIKSGWTNGFYDAGFTNEIALIGSAYNAPASGQRGLFITNGIATLQGGNLPASMTNTVFISDLNKVGLATTNGAMTLTFLPATGALQGSFRHPQNPALAPTLIHGAYLQEQNIGGGFFNGTNQSGSLLLQAD